MDSFDGFMERLPLFQSNQQKKKKNIHPRKQNSMYDKQNITN